MEEKKRRNRRKEETEKERGEGIEGKRRKNRRKKEIGEGNGRNRRKEKKQRNTSAFPPWEKSRKVPPKFAFARQTQVCDLKHPCMI